MIAMQIQTALTRWLNVVRPLGLKGENSPNQGYPPDDHAHEIQTIVYTIII